MRDAPKQSPRRAEAKLSFMLAEQALARWNFRLEQLHQLASIASTEERDLLLVEAKLGAQQMASLAGRLQSFSRSTVLPIRFEAQEMLIAVARIDAQLARIQRQLSAGVPAQAAEEVATTLLARARRGRSSRPHAKGGWRKDARAPGTTALEVT